MPKLCVITDKKICTSNMRVLNYSGLQLCNSSKNPKKAIIFSMTPFLRLPDRTTELMLKIIFNFIS